jgi:glycosyltransferase involved in cell wall biosynthesis
VHVIPNAVPAPTAEPFRHAGRSEERAILAVGRLEPQKGFDVLLRAFADVARSRPEWRLRIAGEGPERGRLEALVFDLGIEDRVNLDGVVSDIDAAMRSADLFVLSSRYEGFPNALCEAMASGLPVIATDCPVGPREIVRDGIDGVLVPPEDERALAGAMDRLMDDPASRERLGAAASAIAERFTPVAILDRWESLLRTVTDGDGS